MPYKDPEQRRANQRERQARYRASAKGQAVERERQAGGAKERHRHGPERPFAGFDGEGWGLGPAHALRMLRAGDSELYAGGEPLQLANVLHWMVGLPDDQLYVGFHLGYDWNVLLSQLPVGVFDRLYHRAAREVVTRDGRRLTAHAEWEGFKLDWLPNRKLYVRRVSDDRAFRVFDAGGCFQMSFVKAVTAWSVGTPDELTELAAMKAYRADFGELAAEPGGVQRISRYNELECKLLAEMMERFRDVCDGEGIHPQMWSGAGQLAQAKMRREGVGRMLPPRTPNRRRDPQGLELAPAAYYGGWFDVAAVGVFPAMYQYDIRSAYPDALRRLPCLAHARIVHGRQDGAYQLQRVSWKPTPGHGGDRRELPEHRNRPGGYPWNRLPEWGAFPIRHGARRDTPLTPQDWSFDREWTPGTLYYPKRGEGWYWSPEVDAVIASRPEYRVRVLDAYSIVAECDCQPFAWIPELYDLRVQIGKSGRGMVIKLALNSLYGKVAQQIGSPTFASATWAGLVTSQTRAKLHTGIGIAGPENVVMVATDAMYTTTPLPDDALSTVNELGAWEAMAFGRYMIVQPGLHTDLEGGQCKTRGVPRELILENLEALVSHWSGQRRWRGYVIPVQGFVSCAHAYHVGRPELAGTWATADRAIHFGSIDKRRQDGVTGQAPTADDPTRACVLPLYRDGQESAPLGIAAAEKRRRMESFRDTGQLDYTRFREALGDYGDPTDAIWTNGEVFPPHG